MLLARIVRAKLSLDFALPPPPPSAVGSMSSFPETPHQSRTRESLDSVSPLTATPSTLPPSTGRRTPRGRGQPRRASAAFSPAFSSMSVRGELAMGGRGDAGGRSSNSTGRRGSGGSAADGASAAVSRGAASARSSADSAANRGAASPATPASDGGSRRSAPSLRECLASALDAERNEQLGGTRGIGREAAPSGATARDARAAKRNTRKQPPSDVTNRDRDRPLAAKKKPAAAAAAPSPRSARRRAKAPSAILSMR